VKPDRCGYFRPANWNPIKCRWWIEPLPNSQITYNPFCCHERRMGQECPTLGETPQPQEEDSFE
jgi:hypothetical protein